MLKKLRIRTEIGVDKEVTFDLNQEFDLLEILSLHLHQTDIYPRDCSEFGVIAGRVLVNGGFGLPNAKISVFIPLSENDEENEVIKKLYPYKTQNYRNEDGYRYNLLPSSPSYTGHLSTGSFPDIDDVLLKQEVSYVYNKYYKFTVKTNDAGDFMIYGVPLGEQSLIMNVDLSDIGCFSMVPEDFKLQGFPESDFNGASFKTGSNVDALPQIVMMSTSVDVKPLWGDEESGCGAAITRADFDLREAGKIEIRPTAVFMGSMASDTEKNSVNRKCKPKRHMGDLCSLAPTPGTIESIRFTPFWKQQARPADFVQDPGKIEEVPVLERYDIDGGFTIDSNGAWLINVPMNLEYVVTNEFGEREISQDPTVGIPTKGKYRFRIKPLETTGSARQRKRAAFLVPQIKEYYSPQQVEIFGISMNKDVVNTKTYNFTTDYMGGYPEPAINMGEIIACKDMFYEFNYGRAYAVSQFHNHWKAKPKDAFIGIKEVVPREADDCGGEATKFPINSATKNVNFYIVFNQFFTRMLQYLWTAVYWIMVFVCTLVEALGIIFEFIEWIIRLIWCVPCYVLCNFFRKIKCSTCCQFDAWDPFSCEDVFGCLHLRVTKYPECDKCGCYKNTGGCLSDCHGNCDDEGDDDDDYVDCTGPTVQAMNLEDGCYNIQWDNIFKAIGSMFSQDDTTPVTQIADWRKRENLFRSMCDGLMNYFWSNNWVTGFLYAFQFKAKIKPDSDEETGFKVKSCKSLVVFHALSRNFYYRCTPYVYDPATNSGYFRGAAGYDARQFSWIDIFNPVGVIKMLNDITTVNLAEGGNRTNILAPTTIMDLGPLIENISEICSETGGAAEGCSIANDLGSTTFSDPGEFMFDAINEIVTANNSMFNLINLRTPFRRNENSTSMYDGKRRELNGGLATIVSQLNEVGTEEYSRPDDTSIALFAHDLTYLPYGGTNNNPAGMGNWTADNLGWDYSPPGECTPNGGWANVWSSTPPPPLFPPPTAAWNNAWIGPDGENLAYWQDRSICCPYIGSNDAVQLTVGLTTATTSNQSGADIRDCLNRYLSNTSQWVPFFYWDKKAPGYGASDRDESSDFATAQFDIVESNFQNRDAWVTQNGSTFIPTTPITSNQTQSKVALGTGYHFYFGLKPGATAYDIFFKKYVPLNQEEEGYYI